jgi:hypothetical protein
MNTSRMLITSNDDLSADRIPAIRNRINIMRNHRIHLVQYFGANDPMVQKYDEIISNLMRIT